MMKSLYEELGGTYTLGVDGMYYPNLILGETEHRPIGRWGRMHLEWLEAERPGLYEQLILNGTLYKHLADANERAERMLEQLKDQLVKQEDISKTDGEAGNVAHQRLFHVGGRAERAAVGADQCAHIDKPGQDGEQHGHPAVAHDACRLFAFSTDRPE